MSRRDSEALVDAALGQVVADWQKEWPKLAEIRRQLDVDWSGDDAVRVWVILDDAGQPEWQHRDVAPIREAIRDSLAEAGVEAWPYIRFRSKVEQDELDREEEEARCRKSSSQFWSLRAHRSLLRAQGLRCLLRKHGRCHPI